MEDLPPVRFNARVEPPILEEPPPSPPAKKSKPTPAPVPVPVAEQCPFTSQSDPVLDALPTILVGIGAAYLVGMATGAFIFSSPVE